MVRKQKTKIGKKETKIVDFRDGFRVIEFERSIKKRGIVRVHDVHELTFGALVISSYTARPL